MMTPSFKNLSTYKPPKLHFLVTKENQAAKATGSKIPFK